MGQQARGFTHPMESDSTFWDPQLPCPSGQILTLYQQLFQSPAGLDELFVAVQQVRGSNCPPELELPSVLLEMERRRLQQEQVLWDLELLAGAGLSLLWPRWGRPRGPRNEARSSVSHNKKSCVWVGGDKELHPRYWTPPQERDIRKRSQQFLEQWRTEGLEVKLGIARGKGGGSEPNQRLGSPRMPGWVTLGPEAEAGTSLKADTWEPEGMPPKSQTELPGEEEEGFTQEPHFPAEYILKDQGSPSRQKRLKGGAQEDLEKGESESEHHLFLMRGTESLGMWWQYDPGQALPEFRAPGPHQRLSWILYFGGKRTNLTPETLKPGELCALPEQEGSWKGANLGQERTETQAFVGREIPKDQKGKSLQSWREESSKLQRGVFSKAQKKEWPQIQIQDIQREETPRSQGVEIPQLQTEETSKLQRGENLLAQKNETPKAQEKSPEPQTEEIPKLQREKIPWAWRNETPKAQGEENPWAQKEEISQAQRETPKTQKGEISQIQEENPNIQIKEISQAQRRETQSRLPKAHKGEIPQVLREETSEGPTGDTPTTQHLESSQIQEREKQMHRQPFQSQGSQFLHSLEGENLQFHKEVSQVQKREILKFWGKKSPWLDKETLFLFQGKETKQSPEVDTQLFHIKKYPQSQRKEILQPQGNRIPWKRKIPWSLGKAIPQLRSQVRLGARLGEKWLPSQEVKLPKTPVQGRLGEQEAVKLGLSKVRTEQALGAAVKKEELGPGVSTRDGLAQLPSLLPNHGMEELKQCHPNSPSKELFFLGLTLNQQENTLKRLLELQSEAGRRYQRDREQQRLKVQERLYITRNRRSGGDPLGSSPTTTQPWIQGDVAQRRHALRKQLEQRHKERTGLLQAQRDRNTQNFQELLGPQGFGGNPQLLPALFQPSWDLRRVSGQSGQWYVGGKDNGKLPDSQKSEVSTGHHYKKARDLTNHKGPGDPGTHTHHIGSQLCPT